MNNVTYKIELRSFPMFILKMKVYCRTIFLKESHGKTMDFFNYEIKNKFNKYFRVKKV